MFGEQTEFKNDLNNLYNVQDVILLSEIIKNRFETMHKTLKSVTQLVQ